MTRSRKRKGPPKTLVSENDVKELVIEWFARRKAWHYAPTQSGMGATGIHDRLGSVPLLVTQQMVGKTIGLFVSIEAKRPGRRGERHRGMSGNQVGHALEIIDAGGIAICCDGTEDLEYLDSVLNRLQHE